MVITSFKIFRYSLPLSRPLAFLKHAISVREGFIIKLIFDQGPEGVGEIAPLPGFSNTKIEECLENLRETGIFLKKEQFSVDTLEKDFFEKLDKIFLYPEVRFGVEMAVLNAAAAQKQLPLSRFLSAHTVEKVVLNGLVPESNDSLELQIARLLQDGYKLIKIKVGGNVFEDANRLKAVMRMVNSRAQVHVDANQNWSFEEANLFAKEVDGCNIKYIEEPFSDISRIPEFFRNTGIPVALDETLFLRGFDYLKPLEGVRFFVLKPMLLGGVRKVLRIAHEARKNGIQMIISSSFESGIGLITLGSLAAAAGPDVCSGIDTLKWFEKDLLKNPLPIKRGELTVSGKVVSESDIRREYLIEV